MAAKTRKTAVRKSAAKKSTPKTTGRRTKKSDRDLEKTYSTKQFVAKLRRLADALEKDKPFKIQVAGERIAVPAKAAFNIEHEREKGEEEVEFQIKWKAA